MTIARLASLIAMLACSLVHAGARIEIKAMQVELAKPDAAGKQTYVSAPDALEALDGRYAGRLRISLPDPTPWNLGASTSD